MLTQPNVEIKIAQYNHTKIEDLCHLRGNIAPGAFKPGFSVLGFSVACTAVLLCVFVMFS